MAFMKYSSRLGWVCLSLLVLLDVAFCNERPSEVVVLDDGNFARLTKEGVWLLMFYAPWCGHCKRVMPVWEQTANALKPSGIKVGKIDADSETDVAQKYKIQEGNNKLDYKGEPSLDSFVKFAQEYKQKSPERKAVGPSEEKGLQGILGSMWQILSAFAAEKLGLYTFIVWGTGFFAGLLIGVVFALREKEKIS